MPLVLRLLTRSRTFWARVPWARVWVTAVWLARKGWDRVKRNLSERERRELVELMQKSRGRRRNLSLKEQLRFRTLVRKAAVGERR
jgi:hypothetical protein